ncbi:MAG: hypothetical protein WBY99_00535 [Kaistella sp.]
MSFVGPRPDIPGYADLLTGEDRQLLNRSILQHIMTPSFGRIKSD